MHGKYFFLVFVFIFLLASPVAGSLTKITAGAPVYVGEQNLDISAGLQGCRVIEWWEAGADTTAPAQKNVTVIKTLEDSDISFSYTIRPEIFSGYEGTWYCEGKRPLRPVFEVLEPRLSVRFWDLDADKDVTGTTVPLTDNITFRIETNLDKAHQLKYRPEMTALDSFYTVILTDPANKSLLSVYTGSYGKTDSRGLVFDGKPIISASPFYWKDGSAWDRTSRNIQGDNMYPTGMYSVFVTQNLNRMKDLYANVSPERKAGLLYTSATVTFAKPESTPAQTVSVPPAVVLDTVTTLPEVSPSAPLPGEVTISPAPTTVPTKVTYSPLPFWIIPAAIGMAFACALRQKNQ